MKSQPKQAKPKKKKPTMDLGLVLLVTGALSNITIWVGAFLATEADGPVSEWVRAFFLPVLGGISGLAMGVTVTVGLVYVLARLGKMKPIIEQKVRGKDEFKSRPNIRFYGAWVAIALLLVISPALLGPYVFATISGAESLYAVLGAQWARAWSVGRIVAADLAMSAVALVHGVHFVAVGDLAPASTSAKSATRTPKKAARTSKALRPCDVPDCGLSYNWPNGKGAHFRKHHPDLVVQKGIPAKVSLPIK
jgi:hypothetical protein